MHIPNIEDTTAYTAAVQYSDVDDDNDNNQQKKQAPAVCIRDQPRARTISSSPTDKVCVHACVCITTLIFFFQTGNFRDKLFLGINSWIHSDKFLFWKLHCVDLLNTRLTLC